MKAFHESEKEMLNIFDENKNHIGTATRAEVHRLGHWHEAFHCWFVGREGEKDYIYFQLRSHDKKDYPNLLDITAAGHLLADETVEDGTREIKEEIGISVSFDDLEGLGVVDYCVVGEHFVDKEIAYVFMYRYNGKFEDFVLQKEEVAGVFRSEFVDFYKLWMGELNKMNMDGFKIDENGYKVLLNVAVQRDHFVPHDKSFYQNVVERIDQKIRIGSDEM